MTPRRVYEKNSGTTSFKKSLYEMTPVLLYEMVSFVRNGIFCTKWSLYEMVFVRNGLTTVLKWVWSLPAPAWTNYAPGYWIVYKAHILDFLQNFNSVKVALGVSPQFFSI